MAALHELINRPVRLEGKVVVLIPDVMTDRLEHQGEGYSLIAEGTSARPAVYVSEQNLRAIKAKYTCPVYGLWHVLHHSGLLSAHAEVQVIPDTERDGLFVRFLPETGRLLRTGEYTDGIFQNAGDLRLEDALPIEIKLETLRLPPEQAMSIEELSHRFDQAKRKEQVVFGVLLAGVVGLAILLDLFFQFRFGQQLATYETRKTILTRVNAEVMALGRTRLAKMPLDVKLLEQLQKISWIDPKFQMKTQSLAEKALTAEIPASVLYSPDTVEPWLKATQLPTGAWQVHWGGAEHAE